MSYFGVCETHPASTKSKVRNYKHVHIAFGAMCRRNPLNPSTPVPYIVMKLSFAFTGAVVFIVLLLLIRVIPPSQDPRQAVAAYALVRRHPKISRLAPENTY